MRLLDGLFFAILGIACGGSSAAEVPGSASPGPGDPGDRGGVMQPDPSTGGSSGSTAPTPSAPAKPGDPAKPAADRRIDPIEVGREWTFDVKVLGIYPVCSNGTYTAKAQKAETVDGKPAIFVTSFCPNSPGFNYSVDGDNVSSHYLGEWIESLVAPVQQGHTWTDGYLDYKWESKGTVTVPAGTFDECWSATTVASYTSYILLCRGVGPVRWHFEDGWGNGYDATLVKKNF